jgi:hypothetical protein
MASLMKKLIFLVGGIAGFMLGSYAGRGPFERVAEWSRQLAGRPQVQRVADQVSESAAELGNAATASASKAADRAASATAEVVGNAADRASDTMIDLGDRRQAALSSQSRPRSPKQAAE